MKRYGLCCISLALQDRGFKSSTMTKTRFLQLNRKEAEKIVAERTLNNVMVARKTIEFCAQKNWNYRISSGMMPLETLPDVNLLIENTHNFNGIQNEFNLASSAIKKNNVRCSTHPDQFVVPASANPMVASKSVIELNMHGKMMDMFGLSKDYNSPINIHMNCFKGGDLKDTAKRFIDVYNELQQNVKSRLVLELEDKPNSWGLFNLLKYIHEPIGIPITYDSLHFRLNNPENIQPSEAIKLCIKTWGKYRPLFHYSNGKSSSTDRAHSDYVYELHTELFEHDIDIEFEFKMKDHAIEKFISDYPALN
jgi:UV DNA damage endonuclease